MFLSPEIPAFCSLSTPSWNAPENCPLSASPPVTFRKTGDVGGCFFCETAGVGQTGEGKDRD